MRMIRPVTIDDSVLVSNSEAETVPEYNAGTEYDQGDIVRDDATHRLYESQQDTNTGHDLDDVAWWVDIGPTNPWAMFDLVNSTQTEASGELEIVIDVPQRVDSLALMNMVATGVTVVAVSDSDGEVFNQEYGLVSESGIDDWWSYFFEPISRITDLVITDIPLYSDLTITVTITGVDIALGTFVVGLSRDTGVTVYGARVGIVDYSRKEADDFGNFTLVERSFSRKANFEVVVENSDIDDLLTLLSAFRASPVVWQGTGLYNSTAVFGFYRDFGIVIEYPTKSKLSIEIEGLT